jgi:hypothetical protein
MGGFPRDLVQPAAYHLPVRREKPRSPREFTEIRSMLTGPMRVIFFALRPFRPRKTRLRVT